MQIKSKQTKGRNGTTIPLLFFAAVLPLAPLLISGFPQTHDGYHHFVRIAHFVNAFRESHVLPTWAGNLNQSLGSPAFLYNWLLLYYLALPLVILKIPIVVAVKIVVGTFFVGSIFGFYLWTRNFFTEKQALFASILYLTAPYHLYNIYVRGAFGEAMALALVPWVLYSSTKLLLTFTARSFVAFSSLLSLLILAHHPTALILVPFLVGYAVVLRFELEKKVDIRPIPLAILTALALTFFFWFPAMVEMPYTKLPQAVSILYENHFLEADRFGTPEKITTMIIGRVPQITIFRGAFLIIIRFLYVIASLAIAVGVLQTLVAGIGAYLMAKNRKIRKPLSIFFLLVLIVALFLTTKPSIVVWRMTPLLPSLLYPWRLNGIATLAAAFLAGTVIKGRNKISLTASIIGLAAILFLTKAGLASSNFQRYPDSDLFQDQSSTDPPGAYLPRWTTDIEALPNEPPGQIAVSSDAKLRTILLERGTTNVRFRAMTDKETTITVNAFFFPAWKAFVDRIPTPIAPSPQGLIQLSLPAGENEVQLEFTRTQTRTAALTFSLLTIFILFAIMAGNNLQHSEYRRRIALLTLSTLVALLMGELFARKIFPKPDEARCVQPDEFRHHSFIPKATCEFSHPDWGTVSLRINSLGLRDREFTIPKPEGAYRVLMLGDSFTEGWGVELEQTFTKLLESHLQNRYPSRKIEVVNAGLHAYSPLVEYLLLREQGLALEPNLIIVNVDANDVSDEAAYYKIAEVSEDGKVIRVSEITGNIPLLQKLHTRISDKSRLYKIISSQMISFIKTKLQKQRAGNKQAVGQFEQDIAVAMRETVKPTEEVLWHWSKNSLLLIKELSEEKNIPLLLVVYPYGVQVNDYEWPGRVQSHFELGKTYPTRNLEVIESFAEEQKIPVVNMLDAFRNSDTFPLFYPTDGHFTPAGHKVFAEQLFEHLTANEDHSNLSSRP